MEPAPELVAGVTVTGDCSTVRSVVGDQVTVCGALVMVKVTEVVATAYVSSLGAVAVRMQVPGAVKVITAVAAVTAQPVTPAERTEYAGVPGTGEIVASGEAA
jgi:hypothetical protein